MHTAARQREGGRQGWSWRRTAYSLITNTTPSPSSDSARAAAGGGVGGGGRRSQVLHYSCLRAAPTRRYVSVCPDRHTNHFHASGRPAWPAKQHNTHTHSHHTHRQVLRKSSQVLFPTGCQQSTRVTRLVHTSSRCHGTRGRHPGSHRRRVRGGHMLARAAVWKHSILSLFLDGGRGQTKEEHTELHPRRGQWWPERSISQPNGLVHTNTEDSTFIVRPPDSVHQRGRIRLGAVHAHTRTRTTMWLGCHCAHTDHAFPVHCTGL